MESVNKFQENPLVQKNRMVFPLLMVIGSLISGFLTDKNRNKNSSVFWLSLVVGHHFNVYGFKSRISTLVLYFSD
ncbi:hypothetical protein BCR22_13170 [Enterococcus plantarum]|nr:hypothetical protein BCR22_13170 [Enterococcus plantarum]